MSLTLSVDNLEEGFLNIFLTELESPGIKYVHRQAIPLAPVILYIITLSNFVKTKKKQISIA